ncbi:uncharacterized protein LOC109595677 [Aethina tumida]|uniref:uncharacterized protein LOC109595677 n=1 Tax=Aethina tumida TaxID=116153 RepID=UPI00096AF44B|nr:uncharacterized protein LOC109595677 [Aethina tumida]
MAYTLFVFAGLLAFANSHGIAGYSAALPVSPYSTIINTPAIEKTVVHHPDPIISTRTVPITVGSKVVSPAKTSVYSEEPNVHEHSTFIRTAPGLTRTVVQHPAPIVNSRISYPAPIVHERLHHPAPIVAPSLQYGGPVVAEALPVAPVVNHHAPIGVPPVRFDGPVVAEPFPVAPVVNHVPLGVPAARYGEPLVANSLPVSPIQW